MDNGCNVCGLDFNYNNGKEYEEEEEDQQRDQEQSISIDEVADRNKFYNNQILGELFLDFQVKSEDGRSVKYILHIELEHHSRDPNFSSGGCILSLRTKTKQEKEARTWLGIWTSTPGRRQLWRWTTTEIPLTRERWSPRPGDMEMWRWRCGLGKISKIVNSGQCHHHCLVDHTSKFVSSMTFLFTT